MSIIEMVTDKVILY